MGRKLGLAFTFETATESPASIVVSRIDGDGRGPVAASPAPGRFLGAAAAG